MSNTLNFFNNVTVAQHKTQWLVQNPGALAFAVSLNWPAVPFPPFSQPVGSL
jgi:hypothetical protein